MGVDGGGNTDTFSTELQSVIQLPSLLLSVDGSGLGVIAEPGDSSIIFGAINTGSPGEGVRADFTEFVDSSMPKPEYRTTLPFSSPYAFGASPLLSGNVPILSFNFMFANAGIYGEMFSIGSSLGSQYRYWLGGDSGADGYITGIRLTADALDAQPRARQVPVPEPSAGIATSASLICGLLARKRRSALA